MRSINNTWAADFPCMERKKTGGSGELGEGGGRVRARVQAPNVLLGWWRWRRRQSPVYSSVLLQDRSRTEWNIGDGVM